MVKYSRLPKKKENEKVECRRSDVTSCERLCGGWNGPSVAERCGNVDLIRLRDDFAVVLLWLIGFVVLACPNS